MDEQRVSVWSFDSLPAWATLFGLAAHLAAGIALGAVYFHAVWWSARLFAEGGRAATVIALIAGRLAVLGGLLALASLEGAAQLLMMALGVLIARSAALRGRREIAR
jgi:F1F0 ATPase subunit 2